MDSQRENRRNDIEPGSFEPTLSLFQGMMHPDDRLGIEDFDRILLDGVSVEREFRLVRPDGRIRWVANKGEPIINGKGRIEKAVGVVHDVTSKCNAMQQLRAIGARQETLANFLSAFFWTTSPDGLATDVPAWRTLTGQSVSQMQGHGWLDAVHPEDRAAVMEAWTKSIALRTNYHSAFRVKLKDGTYRWFNAKGAPVVNVDGEVKEWIGILTGGSETSSFSENSRWLTGAQARAARAILNWTVKDISEAAKVSISTIKRLEESDGPSNLRSDIANAIRSAFEQSGVEFIDLASGPPAVRLRRTKY
jgi:PAS domain S-box-containing protein